MSNSFIPVVVGLAAGITLIVIMITVASSLERYDMAFYGDGGVNVVTYVPDHEPFYSSPPQVVIDDYDEADSAKDDLENMTFGQELDLTLTEDDE